MEASIQSCRHHSQRFCRWRALVNILFIRIDKKVQSKTRRWCFYQWHISRTCINNCYLCNMSAVGGTSYWMDWWNDLLLRYTIFFANLQQILWDFVIWNLKSFVHSFVVMWLWITQMVDCQLFWNMWGFESLLYHDNNV